MTGGHDDGLLLYPTAHAAADPDRAAIIDVATGQTVTYRALEERSRAVACRLLAAGLREGDHVAVAMGNAPEFLEICWAAHRIGLYYTAVNTHLSPAEARHVVADCGARVLFADAGRAALAAGFPHLLRVAVETAGEGSAAGEGSREGEAHQGRAGFEDYDAIARAAAGPLPRECEGEKMLYTSGTTGVPKGVARPLTGAPAGSVFLIRPLMERMGFGAACVLVSPAPLYHSAPLGYAMGVHRLGGTVVIDRRFDATRCLQAIGRYQASHGLFVPTMFARMLRLPGRAAFDISSMRGAVHGAAPCPVAVKQAMIDWWGPVLFEYYAATEGAGMTLIDSAQWLAHPGSVGRPVGSSVHIVDDRTGAELPAGETGTVYFSGGSKFAYHGDAAKTAAAHDARGRATLGDVGHVDGDGFLYLTDRKSFTVISGGVNIYPQEFENLLAGHPAVADVAAFGVPDDDLGERLVAVAELQPDAAVTADELLAWAGARMSAQKLPRRLTFTGRLPRAENGKLYKRQLRAEYLKSQPAASPESE